MTSFSSRHSLRLSVALLTATSLSTGCSSLNRSNATDPTASSTSATDLKAQKANYLESGSIIISRRMPDASADVLLASNASPVCETTTPKYMAPMIGYVPPTTGFLPAENEAWMEINRQAQRLVLYKGTAVVKEIPLEGPVGLEPGQYALQFKQKAPLWYANDDYFKKRQLTVPPADDQLRFRRGALGPYALYPTKAFPIHSSPLWADDVGGLRLPKSELQSIYYMVPIGSSIVVK